MSDVTICPTCNQPQVVPCPCGTCDLRTPYSACPTCDPERVAKLQKMHGVQVCRKHAMAAIFGKNYGPAPVQAMTPEEAAEVRPGFKAKDG